jgi:hypothetical protein
MLTGYLASNQTLRSEKEGERKKKIVRRYKSIRKL